MHGRAFKSVVVIFPMRRRAVYKCRARGIHFCTMADNAAFTAAAITPPGVHRGFDIVRIPRRQAKSNHIDK